MAESVDALVSNTSGATRAGSTPALGTIQRLTITRLPSVFLYAYLRRTRATLQICVNALPLACFSIQSTDQ